MNRSLERVIATGLRGRLLDRPARFVLRELTGSTEVKAYRARESGVWLHLQHGTPDVLVLDEIFYQRLYEPPAEVAPMLRAPLRALDAGANIGMFGVWLLGRFPESEVLSLEPDARNASLLRRTIEANHAAPHWRLVQGAAATAAGKVGFAGSDFATSHVVEDPNAPMVPAVDFFEQAEGAQLIKIDIEGSEWPILADPRMAQLDASVLVLEYHPDKCPQPDTHATAHTLLERAGYASKPIFQAASGVGMLWAWRPA
jgi:FkbM family methyltransferase